MFGHKATRPKRLRRSVTFAEEEEIINPTENNINPEEIDDESAVTIPSKVTSLLL